MVFEHCGEHGSRWAAIESIAAKIGCTADKERIKALEPEVRELCQANEILCKASAYFAQAELDRPFKLAFIVDVFARRIVAWKASCLGTHGLRARRAGAGAVRA